MLKQNIRPPLVMALESQNLEWLKLVLSSPDTRLDHVEDDSCTPGSKTAVKLTMSGSS
jgi:hypothetical protein